MKDNEEKTDEELEFDHDAILGISPLEDKMKI